MKTIVSVLAAMALTLATSPPGRAQVMLDVAKITCWQFVTYKVTSPKFLAIWMSGYQHGKRGDTVIDTQYLATKADKIEDYCTKNPDVPFMQAVETDSRRTQLAGG
jgi:acid stress chaperone HdeB